jgi:hypothetical protein
VDHPFSVRKPRRGGMVVLRDTKSSRFIGALTRHLEKIMRDLVLEGTWQGATMRR